MNVITMMVEMMMMIMRVLGFRAYDYDVHDREDVHDDDDDWNRS